MVTFIRQRRREYCRTTRGENPEEPTPIENPEAPKKSSKIPADNLPE